MKTLTRKIAALCTAVLICLSLAGCVRMDFHLTIRSNGKADINILYAVNDAMAAYSDTEIISEEAIEDYKEKGYTVTPYSEDDYTGITLSKTNAVLSEVSDPNGGVGNMAGENFITRDGSKYILNMNIFDNEEMKDGVQYLGMIASSGGYMRFTLTTPVKATNHNATSVSEDGKTLTWDLLAMNGEPVHAEFSLISVIWIPILIAVLLAALAAAVVILRKKRNSEQGPDETAEEAAAAEDEPAVERTEEEAPSEEAPSEETATGGTPEDTVSEAASEPAPAAAPETAADENLVISQLREYKKLMDEGVITAEEFEKKKQQLLNLH